MANYKLFENETNVFVEQNIHDNNELRSYDAQIETSTGMKTSVLYYYETKDKERFYSLGLSENLDSPNIVIIANDLTNAFKFKTAKVRRKYIYDMIRDNEKLLQAK